jgi:hypothetical protein
MPKIPIQLLTLVPEPWALDAAKAICDQTTQILADLGYPSRGPEYHERTIQSVARLIQYSHDRALPKDRN